VSSVLPSSGELLSKHFDEHTLATIQMSSYDRSTSMPAPTIYDVATRAGVSISTVSLALNAPERVREGTLRRVLTAADELGFVPKVEAVTRARHGVRRIGVFAAFTTHPSYARRLNGVLQAAAHERFEIVVYDQDEAAIVADEGIAATQTRSRLATLPLTGRVDGLIVMSPPFDDEIAQRLMSQHVTTVLVGLTWPGFSSVVTDDARGAGDVARLLAGRGHSRVAYIGGADTRWPGWPSAVRLESFRAALDVEPEVRLTDPTHPYESALSAARELLGQSDRPTAIFAGSDLLASGALRAAQDLGLAVPSDVAVVGFDDGDLAEPLALTTVRQPFEESGQVATEILLSQLEDRRRSARQTTLSVSLVERSTA
jgi:DNA-binding LacI/PurR family transcriptional regulator